MYKVLDDEEFGLYVNIPDYDIYDELEDFFVEEHDIVPLAVQEVKSKLATTYRLWFDHGANAQEIQNVVNHYFENNS